MATSSSFIHLLDHNNIRSAKHQPNTASSRQQKNWPLAQTSSGTIPATSHPPPHHHIPHHHPPPFYPSDREEVGLVSLFSQYSSSPTHYSACLLNIHLLFIIFIVIITFIMIMIIIIFIIFIITKSHHLQILIIRIKFINIPGHQLSITPHRHHHQNQNRETIKFLYICPFSKMYNVH